MAVSTHGNISGVLCSNGTLSSYETCAAFSEKKSLMIISRGFAVSKFFSGVLTSASLLLSVTLTMAAQLFLVSKDLLLGVSLILGLSLLLLICPWAKQS